MHLFLYLSTYLSISSFFHLYYIVLTGSMVHANLSLNVLRMLHAAVFEFSGIDDSTMMKDDFKLRMITAFKPIGQTHGWPLGIST